MVELWIKAVAGDKAAEQRIFEYLRERFVFITKCNIDNCDVAEDIAHDACLGVFQKYRSLDWPFEYNAWAHKILKNKISDYHQSNNLKRKTRAMLQPTNNDNGNSINYHDPNLELSLFKCLKKLINGYSRYARVLNLVQQGYRTEEVCSRLNIKRNNFYIILMRGRKLINDCIFGESGN